MSQQTEIEDAVFRRLLKHLDDNKAVQNIDLMITADFCRNCLSKWYMTEAEKRGESHIGGEIKQIMNDRRIDKANKRAEQNKS